MVLRFSPSLHDEDVYADHDSYQADRWSENASSFMRMTVEEYKEDDEDRTRWGGTTRHAASLQQVENMTLAGYVTSPTVGPNTEAWGISDNSNHAHVKAFVIGDNSKRQTDIEQGESGLANPDNPKQQIKFDKDGNIRINAPDKKVHVESAKEVEFKPSESMTIETPTLKITGDVEFRGNIRHITGTFSGVPHP